MAFTGAELERFNFDGIWKPDHVGVADTDLSVTIGFFYPLVSGSSGPPSQAIVEAAFSRATGVELVAPVTSSVLLNSVASEA